MGPTSNNYHKYIETLFLQCCWK